MKSLRSGRKRKAALTRRRKPGDRLEFCRCKGALGSLGLPRRIRACLFDLDGVLTRTAKLHSKAWKQAFDEFLRKYAKKAGKAFRPFDAVRDYDLYVDGKLRVEGARSFLASRGIHLSDKEMTRLTTRKDKILLEILGHERVETYESSVRYVREVREAGLRTAVVSSSKHCAQFLASAGITDLFDVRVDGKVAARKHLAGKPAPDTYLAAARAVGAKPAQAVVFEDALSGVEAGHAGHFGFVVGVDRAGQAAQLCRRGADVVVKDLGDLLEKGRRAEPLRRSRPATAALPPYPRERKRG